MNLKPKNSNPRVISNTISFGMISIISLVLALVSTIILTRYFSVNDFGVYTIIFVIVSFLAQISNLGLEYSVPKFIASTSDNIEQEIYCSTAVIIRIGSILLISLLAWIGIPLIKLLLAPSLLSDFFFYVLLLFALESFKSLLIAILQGRFHFSKIGIINLFAGFSNLGLVIVVCTLNCSLSFLILGRIILTLFACILSLLYTPIKIPFLFRRNTFKELMKFGYPLQINQILGFIYYRIDTVLVAIFLGPVNIAIYEVARKIPDSLRSIYDPFSSVYFPFISKHYSSEDHTQASKLMNNSIRFVTFVTLLGVVISVLFGADILRLIFTQKYLSATPIFVLFMFNLSISLIGNVMGLTLVAIGDTKKPLIINLINSILSLFGCIVLIPVLTIFGAIIGNTIGTIVALPLNRIFLNKKIDLIEKSYLKPLGLFFVWSILVFLFKPEILGVKVAFLLLYLLGCYLWSIITKNDIALLLDGSGIFSWQPFKYMRSRISKL